MIDFLDFMYLQSGNMTFDTMCHHSYRAFEKTLLKLFIVYVQSLCPTFVWKKRLFFFFRSIILT